ncbi:hypothetical protein DFH07DRAFT_780022 [Mycena maculata]|uniref:C2 domain-containing protein n=1 Tax=Mycena maculata TaxID=230809 RepID=A0AAD7MXR5_9AGAR|nr:hypothetical protein DFH07DRAFT_780022 [Mycena maculata]
MEETYLLQIQSADITQWKGGQLHGKKPRPDVVMSQRSLLPRTGANQDKRIPTAERGLKPQWTDALLTISSKPSDFLLFQVLHDASIMGMDKLIGSHKIEIHRLLELCGSDGGVTNLDLQCKDTAAGTLLVSLSISSPGAAVLRVADNAPKMINSDAKETRDKIMERASEHGDMVSSLDKVIKGLDGFTKIGDAIAKCHPYVHTAWTVLTLVYTVSNC